MAYDILIKQARICDGTGAAMTEGAVGVQDGRIVAVGDASGPARQEINAAGRVLAPGFIDIHTHYDAQIAWDPLLTCSSWHGVTTVLLGNCGVGVAPCRPAQKDVVAWDLVNVEAMPYEVLFDGLAWDWESFPQYMTAMTRRGTALHTAFLVPLSALRFYVMGEAATERAAAKEEITRMAQLLREAMLAGAYGFSLSLLPQHIGYQGRALASRLTSKEELGALARVLRDLHKGVIEMALTRKVGTLADEELALLEYVATESQRPVTFIALLDVPGNDGACEHALARVAPLRQRGLQIFPQTTPRPIQQYYTLQQPFLFASLPSWKAAFNRSVAEQMALYASPAFRQAFRNDLRTGATLFKDQWERLHVVRVSRAEHQAWLNKSIQELAAQQHKDPLDTLLDVALAEDLALGFTMSVINTNPDVVQRLITHPDVLLGLSDAGAHVDQHCDAGLPTYLLHEWVHKRPVLTL